MAEEADQSVDDLINILNSKQEENIRNWEEKIAAMARQKHPVKFAKHNAKKPVLKSDRCNPVIEEESASDKQADHESEESQHHGQSALCNAKQQVSPKQGDFRIRKDKNPVQYQKMLNQIDVNRASFKVMPPMPDLQDAKVGPLYVDHSDQLQAKSKKPRRVPKKLLQPMNLYGGPSLPSTKSMGRTSLPDIQNKGAKLRHNSVKANEKQADSKNRLASGKSMLPPKPIKTGSSAIVPVQAYQCGDYGDSNQDYEEDEDESERVGTAGSQQANPQGTQGRMEQPGAQNSQPMKIQYEPKQIELNDRVRKRFLVFRPYEDPIQIRPYLPPDRGYYFDLRHCDIKIIRYTLEDNGFRELPSAKDL